MDLAICSRHERQSWKCELKPLWLHANTLNKGNVVSPRTYRHPTSKCCRVRTAPGAGRGPEFVAIKQGAQRRVPPCITRVFFGSSRTYVTSPHAVRKANSGGNCAQPGCLAHKPQPSRRLARTRRIQAKTPHSKGTHKNKNPAPPHKNQTSLLTKGSTPATMRVT